MVPPDQREQILGQLMEVAFYMGASFFGGQVSDTLNLDDAYTDEVTRETFMFLTNAAISAMETSGDIMLASGRAYDDSNEND